jgi:DNA adenine methylase
MSRHRTPLRYPGGKQRLAPFVAEVLACNGGENSIYVEPYAGGAGVAMELLVDNRVRQVFLNDSSIHIYAFWRAILSNAPAFCRLISRASLTLDSWKAHREVVRHPDKHDLFELGFSTFYLNRCNRSGVLTAGVIGGIAQKGQWRIDARFPRNELIQRIECIASFKKRIRVSNCDAEKFLLDTVNGLPSNTLVYCDPPYFARAKRLYLNTYRPDDHLRLARLIQSRLRRRWMVSYDNHPTILSLYNGRRSFNYSLTYSAMKAYLGSELFLFSDNLMLPTTSVIPYVARRLTSLRRIG